MLDHAEPEEHDGRYICINGVVKIEKSTFAKCQKLVWQMTQNSKPSLPKQPKEYSTLPFFGLLYPLVLIFFLNKNKYLSSAQVKASFASPMAPNSFPLTASIDGQQAFVALSKGQVPSGAVIPSGLVLTTKLKAAVASAGEALSSPQINAAGWTDIITRVVQLGGACPSHDTFSLEVFQNAGFEEPFVHIIINELKPSSSSKLFKDILTICWLHLIESLQELKEIPADTGRTVHIDRFLPCFFFYYIISFLIF